MQHWNYRIVNVPSANGGEDWFELKEVYYNHDMSLMGYGDAFVGGETLGEVQLVIQHILEAAQRPAMHEDDFKNASFKEGDE